MPKNNLIEFVVSLDRPHGASISDLKDYIEEWVACGKGSRHPDDPIFDLDGDSVKVKRFTSRTKPTSKE